LISLILDWYLTLSILDLELEEGTEIIDKSKLGFFVSLGTKLQDVLLLPPPQGRGASQGQSEGNHVKIQLAASSLGTFDGPQPEKVVVVVKLVGREELKVGSISLPQELFLSCGECVYKQWITLFDHLDDDDYDGDFGDNDEEAPRVLFMFRIEQDLAMNAPI
jgi:hypothetical protein